MGISVPAAGQSPGSTAVCSQVFVTKTLSPRRAHNNTPARRVLSTPPPPGTNTIVTGHGNIMRAATDAYASEGGSSIYKPDPDSETGVALLARLAPEDWMRLAGELGPDG